MSNPKKSAREILDNASAKLARDYNKRLENCLYPGMFDDEYGWSRIRDALRLHDAYLREYFAAAIEEILKEAGND